MAPVSISWGTTEYDTFPPAKESHGPYALSDVLAEIIESYATGTTGAPRDDRTPTPPRPEECGLTDDWHALPSAESAVWVGSHATSTSFPALMI